MMIKRKTIVKGTLNRRVMSGASGALINIPPPVKAPKIPIINEEVPRSSSVNVKSGSISEIVQAKITKQEMADTTCAVDGFILDKV